MLVNGHVEIQVQSLICCRAVVPEVIAWILDHDNVIAYVHVGRSFRGDRLL
jgi:hypothetical protein